MHVGRVRTSAALAFGVLLVTSVAAAQVQVTMSPTSAIVPVGGCFDYTVTLSPAQPSDTYLMTAISDPSAGYSAYAFVPANQSTGTARLCAYPGIVPITLTVTLPSPLGGASASSTATTIFPEPVIVDHFPKFAAVGSAGLTLEIIGQRLPVFTSYTQVLWNGSPRPWEPPTVCPPITGCANILYVSIPASDLAVAGASTVTVLNPPPGGGSASFPFRVLYVASENVPTLTPAVLILFAGVLAGAGVVALRRL